MNRQHAIIYVGLTHIKRNKKLQSADLHCIHESYLISRFSPFHQQIKSQKASIEVRHCRDAAVSFFICTLPARFHFTRVKFALLRLKFNSDRMPFRIKLFFCFCFCIFVSVPAPTNLLIYVQLGLRGDVALRRSGSNLKIDAKLVQAQALQANSFKASVLITCKPFISLHYSFLKRVLFRTGWRYGPRSVHRINHPQTYAPCHVCIIIIVVRYTNYFTCFSIMGVHAGIKPQILNCKPGYTGPFCDQMCTNGDLSKEVYTDGCKTSCKTGFGSMDGKCISKYRTLARSWTELAKLCIQ